MVSGFGRSGRFPFPTFPKIRTHLGTVAEDEVPISDEFVGDYDTQMGLCLFIHS